MAVALGPGHMRPGREPMCFHKNCLASCRGHISMKRGTGGKEPVEHLWILFAIIGNGFQLLGKGNMAAVLGAETQGETHRQNDTSLAGRPKDTNPYPWRDPYRGGGASCRLHKGGASQTHAGRASQTHEPIPMERPI